MPTGAKFSWGLAGLMAAALVVAVVSWLRLPSLPGQGGTAAVPATTAPQLDFSSDSALLGEKMAAYDPTPLFLPTERNSGQAAKPAALLQETGELAAEFPPLLKNSADNFEVQIPDIVPVPVTAVQGLGLTERADAPLAMGRADANFQKLAARSGLVEAVVAGTGQVVLMAPLPPEAGAPDGEWQQTMELLGSVDVAGLVGDLAVVTSSLSAARDDYFRKNLAQVFRVGERLPPGFYVFRVGP